MSNSLFCSWCKNEMAYIHGHASCINNSCSMFGLNQAECCSGENANNCVFLLNMPLKNINDAKPYTTPLAPI